ncbi:sensor histidine kinase [Desulfospira joergensenii]|uniref:sensor histidine kinase n=1 Tax=Desulfospira joergensenii TaxID=53329 RepID=UPI0003B3F7A7|nr:HAMP domain-containing sensor histidine kinase [Desulfospira joergensenii]
MPDTPIKTEILIHDLKVPISVIDAGAKSLLNRQDAYGPLTDKQIKVLKRIIRNTLTSQRLVNDVLELGRSREGVMNYSDFTVSSLVRAVLVEVFDLADPNAAEIIRKVQDYDELLGAVRQVGVKLKFTKATWESVVRQDAAKVRQILRNLATNALKHRVEQIEIQGNLKERRLVLRVRDDGRGIAPSDHQKIFKTYFTTGGSIENAICSHGLGLAGVMVLLKDMGGDMALESDRGKGAEFIVKIPV